MRPGNFHAPGLPSKLNGVRLDKQARDLKHAYAVAERTRGRK